MSSGNTETGETCMIVTKRGRVSIDLKRKDWCIYHGECEVEMTTAGELLCKNCVFRQRFNIPAIIEELKREKQKCH